MTFFVIIMKGLMRGEIKKMIKESSRKKNFLIVCICVVIVVVVFQESFWAKWANFKSFFNWGGVLQTSQSDF